MWESNLRTRVFRVLFPDRGFLDDVIRGSNDDVIIDVIEAGSTVFLQGYETQKSFRGLSI